MHRRHWAPLVLRSYRFEFIIYENKIFKWKTISGRELCRKQQNCRPMKISKKKSVSRLYMYTMYRSSVVNVFTRRNFKVIFANNVVIKLRTVHRGFFFFILSAKDCWQRRRVIVQYPGNVPRYRIRGTYVSASHRIRKSFMPIRRALRTREEYSLLKFDVQTAWRREDLVRGFFFYGKNVNGRCGMCVRTRWAKKFGKKKCFLFLVRRPSDFFNSKG